MFGLLDSLNLFLIYSSVNVLFFFYGVYFARRLINREIEGKNYQKFVVFVIFLIIIGQIITFPNIKKIPALENPFTSSWISLGFLIWSYIQFDRVVIKGLKPSLIEE